MTSKPDNNKIAYIQNEMWDINTDSTVIKR